MYMQFNIDKPNKQVYNFFVGNNVNMHGKTERNGGR